MLQKEAEKKLKYRNLIAEIQKMLNTKCMITRRAIGATGIVTDKLKHLEAIPGKYLHTHTRKENPAVLGTSHIKWKELLI
jgi:hypothetical protein